MRSESSIEGKPVAAESARIPELGRIFYESGPARGRARFADFVRHLDRIGVLNAADPSRRAGAVSPSAQFLAAALGPLAAMAVSALAGPSAVLTLSPLLALAALACAHLSLPRGGPASRDYA